MELLQSFIDKSSPTQGSNYYTLEELLTNPNNLFSFMQVQQGFIVISRFLKYIIGCLTGYKVEVVASLAKKDLTPDMTR